MMKFMKCGEYTYDVWVDGKFIGEIEKISKNEWVGRTKSGIKVAGNTRIECATLMF